MPTSGKIYKNQTALRIRLKTGIDLTDATTVYIKYIKPETQTAGQWTAVIDGDASAGIIYFDITLTTQIDEEGVWKWWSYVVFNDGREAPGEMVEERVYPEPS